MAKLRLTYFDFRGGRGEPIRLALSISNIPFEDNRVPPPDWPNVKEGTPFGGLPVLEVDGKVVAQSNAILRYVGKIANLYPTDPLEAALCDEVMDAVEDISSKVFASRFLPDDERKSQRKALVEGPIPSFLSRLQRRLEAHGDRYFATESLSVADLKVFEWIRNLRSGAIDYIPTDLPERFAPKLVGHFERVKNDPRIKAYHSQLRTKV